MSNGRVCSIHNEWCADGNCRWCEPLPAPAINPWAATGWYVVNQQAQQGIDDCLSRLGALNQQAQQQAVWIESIE